MRHQPGIGALKDLALDVAPNRMWWFAAAAWAYVILGPGGGLMVLAAPMVGSSLRPRLAARRTKGREASNPSLTARLLFIALSAGLPLAAALPVASQRSSVPDRDAIDTVLRRARTHGLAAALTGESGPLRKLFLSVASAHMTGAPALQAVSAFIDDQRGRARAAALSRARKLPLYMLIPVTLLVLPGFLLAAIAPLAIETFGRLVGQLGLP